jgi:hypothetical protein
MPEPGQSKLDKKFNEISENAAIFCLRHCASAISARH